MRVGQARRRDANEADIIQVLEQCGASVLQLSQENAPDLLVGFRGRNWLFEVKTHNGRYRPGQVVWGMGWQGQVRLIRSADEALQAIGAV